MGYEVDFLAVGEESQSGDAIAMRFGDLIGGGEQHIIVIDGGFKETGEKMVAHIREYYRNPEHIDLVVSTHPDNDHISGLAVILDNFSVGQLLMHLPWEEHSGLASKFNDGRVTDNSISERLKRSLDAASDLHEKAVSKGIPVTEPFAGIDEKIGSAQVEVLGPSRKYYDELLPDFDGMPEQKEAMGMFARVGQSLAERMKEFWNKDSITDDAETSARNNSSAILQITVDGRRLLFTGDAGIPALEHAADYLKYQGITSAESNPPLHLIQIPHHGSRRNVGPTVLNHLVGPIVERRGVRGVMAIASCAKKGEPKHPNKRVLNAFTRRDARCYVTQGNGLCSHYQAPPRQGWGNADQCPFYSEIGDEE